MKKALIIFGTIAYIALVVFFSFKIFFYFSFWVSGENDTKRVTQKLLERDDVDSCLKLKAAPFSIDYNTGSAVNSCLIAFLDKKQDISLCYNTRRDFPAACRGYLVGRFGNPRFPK